MEKLTKKTTILLQPELHRRLTRLAAGQSHPHKAPSVAFLEQVAAGKVEAVVNAELLQELLHRYRALDQWEQGRRVFDNADRHP